MGNIWCHLIFLTLSFTGYPFRSLQSGLALFWLVSTFEFLIAGISISLVLIKLIDKSSPWHWIGFWFFVFFKKWKLWFDSGIFLVRDPRGFFLYFVYFLIMCWWINKPRHDCHDFYIIFQKTLALVRKNRIIIISILISNDDCSSKSLLLICQMK